MKVVERLLGLWDWAMLFARPALAIVDKCYHVMRKTTTQGLVRPPEACRREMRCLTALAPFNATDLATPWGDVALATDASTEGYGVVQTRATKAELAEEARYCELRGWTVCLEDEYAARDDMGGYEDDAIEDVTIAAPLVVPTRKILRVAHLFSGHQRKFDVEWWLRVLCQTQAYEVDVVSIDVSVSPNLDLKRNDVMASLTCQVRERGSQGDSRRATLWHVEPGTAQPAVSGPQASPVRNRGAAPT